MKEDKPYSGSMALNFNPYRRSGQQSGSGASVSDVLNANAGVSGALEQVGAGIQNINNVAGDKAVSDLLSSGQLQGVDDTTALARIQQVSGGNISPAMKENLSALMTSRGVDKQIGARADESALDRMSRASLQKGQQEFASAENKASRALTREQNDLARKASKMNLADKLAVQQEESRLDRIQKSAEAKANRDTQVDIANIGQYGQNVRQAEQLNAIKENAKMKNESAIQIQQMKNNANASKLREQDKIAIKELNAGELATASSRVEELISDDMDSVWDRPLDTKSRAIMKAIVNDAVSKPGGASMYRNFGVEGLRDLVYDEMKTRGLNFTDPSFNPFASRGIF